MNKLEKTAEDTSGLGLLLRLAALKQEHVIVQI